jgi:hypothetical protein
MLARRTSFISLIYEDRDDPVVYWTSGYTPGTIGGAGQMSANVYRNSVSGITLNALSAEWQLSTDDGDTYSTVTADTEHVIIYGTFALIYGSEERYKAMCVLNISPIVVGDYGLYRLKATGADDPAYTEVPLEFSDPAA